MTPTQIYQNQIIKIVVKPNSAVTIYPVIYITKPDGSIEALNGNMVLIGEGLYSYEYLITEVGQYLWIVKYYQDSGHLVEVTNTVGGISYGTFLSVLNPLDELLIAHQTQGSLGQALMQLYTMAYELGEIPGDGSCRHDFEVKNGLGIKVVVYDMNNKVVARRILDSSGKTSVYLKTGQYIAKFYSYCGGPEIQNDTQNFSIKCGETPETICS